MSQNGPSTSTDRLQNIRQIMTESGARPALEQVQALLHDDPDNAGLLLLKAELCLKADADDMADEVGSILLNLPPSDEREQLRALALKQAEAKIGKAQAIRRMDAERALGLLERAVSLCPFSPIIAFKSAEILQASFAVNVPEQFRFGELVRQREKPWQGGDRSTSETYKRYLHVALEQAAPGDPAYRAAAERLAVWLLVEGDIGGALAVAERTLPRDGDEGQRFGQLLAALCFRELVGLVRGTVEQARAAVEIMTRCRNGIPRLPSVALLVAEARRRLGDLGGAERAYRQALRLADGEPARLRSWKTAGKALIQARGIVAPCKRCGGMMTPSQPKCEECGTKTSPQQFSGERAGLSNAPDAVFAHLGLAEVLDERGAIDQALQRLSLGLALLGNRQAIPRPVAEMHERLEYEHAQREALRALAAELKGAGPVTDAIVQHVWRLCDESPRIWTVIPPETRQRITEMLIDAGHLGLAGRLITHILAETLPAAMVGALRGRLASAREQQADHRVEQARALLDGGYSEQAAQLAGQALELHRDHSGARLLRGRAAMRLGHYLLALDDFRAAMTDADEALADAARLEAARALERHGEWEGALALLESAPSAEAASIRERIDRRRSGTPVILSVAADGIVMHDTLQRAPSAAFHAMFGIALRMVGHLSAASQPGQYDHLLNAHFEFVQALGGLRHMPGDPLFALRMLSQPDPHISERGSLSITLMVRVTADSEAAARALAGHMWPVVRDVLPSTQDHTYLFEPVVDEAELRYLLEPFTDAEAAEVVRREYVPQQDGERYVVHPFLPGSINLHNLCWALLRQKAPAMVSVHLLPTDVMAWEHAALETALAGEPDSAADVGADDLALEPVLLRAASGSHWTAVVTNRHIADSLATQVYVVRLNVASSGAVSPLLSDVVASTLLGPVRQIGGGSLGGYAIVRPQTDAEMEIARRNLRLLDVEGWVYSAAPERASRIRHLAGEQEAAIVFRLPLPGPDGVPGLARLDVKPVAPPSRLPVNGVILGNSVTRGGDGPIRIRQNVADRRRHMYLVGKTGVGKSTLMENMILQDIEAGRGVCLVDPHGDLVEGVLARIPALRADDVVLFDPSDEDYPVGLNFLDVKTETEQHRVTTEFIGLIMRMYDPNAIGIAGPRFQHNVRNAMLTVMNSGGGTLIEVVRVVSDPEFVSSLLPRVTDPMVRTYWEKQIARTSDFHKSEVLDWIVSKFNRFVGDRLVRNIIGQRTSTLNFRAIMDRRQILLVNLSKGKIGPENAQFLGLLLVQSLLIAALSRADMPSAERPDFCLYVDEFQNFATDLFTTILSEGRKYGVAAVVANQYLTQLDRAVQEAIFGNVGSLVAFQLGIHDVPALVPEMAPVFDASNLLNLPRFTAAVKLLVDGLATRPFTMRTLPDLRPADPALAEAIRERSRRRYGRDAARVGEDIMARFQSGG